MFGLCSIYGTEPYRLRKWVEMRVEDCTNFELVTLAVALMDGDREYVHPEDIAVKVNEMLPGRFSWRRYPDQIDLDAVRVALRDAKKEKNGGLLVGSNVEGWMLSPKGIAWTSMIGVIEGDLDSEISHRRNSLFADQELERNRLRTTHAYQLYHIGKRDEITLQDFHQFAKINEYFRSKARQRRYAIIDNAVVGDKHLAAIWEYLKEMFRKEAA